MAAENATIVIMFNETRVFNLFSPRRMKSFFLRHVGAIEICSQQVIHACVFTNKSSFYNKHFIKSVGYECIRKV